MDRPLAEIQADLSKSFGCREWRGTAASSACLLDQTAGILVVYRDAADGTVETVEMNVLIEDYPRRPAAERRSREAAIKIVRHLVPTWKRAPAWLEDGLADAINVRAWHEIKLGRLTVLVSWLQAADREKAEAWVVVTKRASLDKWQEHDD
jgi:hypothetical protein